MSLSTRWAALLILSSTFAAGAKETKIQYLSGLGKDDPVEWQIRCDNGQNSGKWSTIGVPSNWQLQGFGFYTYGTVPPPQPWPRTHCTYKRIFTTPSNWRQDAVFLNFEGVMTDARVTVNGNVAGPVHQGGYYAFRYDITNLLMPSGEQNEIRVDVDDESADESVNHAERRGDFWNYGGIFRPVYLQAVPKTFIDQMTISATAAGTLDVETSLADLRPNATSAPASLQMRVLDLNGKTIGDPVTANNVVLGEKSHLTGKVLQPLLWTAETPNLYQLEVRLALGGSVVHTVRQRFGFRTVEVRPGQGLFVNGQRVFLRGFDRHSFWPDSGRTLSEQISKDDVMLVKEMNGNAVRTSHYPPDRHFLDACDELGIYVLDELAGWHQYYDTNVGKKLVKEMVDHDVNHPAILFWDNGNEGGFNFDLDAEFAKYDPERRTVLHPWAAYPPGVADTKHYPTYDLLKQKLALDPVLIPTEMLHGLYDGGGGAGLKDYWDAILTSKAGGGGFIWAFLDEDVKRTDKGGILDSQLNDAPDGVVGPYREREASFYAIKDIWSPIVVTPPVGSSDAYRVSNRYAFINAERCTYEWQLIAFHKPNEQASGSLVIESWSDHGRSLAPGASANWEGWGRHNSSSSRGKMRADATRLIIKDPTGRIIRTYVWPLDTADSQPEKRRPGSVLKPIATESTDVLTAAMGDLSLQISKNTGLLVAVSRQNKDFSLANGPRVVAVGPRPVTLRNETPQPLPAVAPESKLTSIEQKLEGNDLVITATFDGPMKSLSYRLKPDGWLSIDYLYSITGAQEYFGIGFDYPETRVKGVRFLGAGPYPVYQDRLAGGALDVWEKAYNNTMVGDPDDLKVGEHFTYPIFKGFYSGVRWMELETLEGQITARIEQHATSPIYVQLFSPKVPPSSLLRRVTVPFPSAGLSFLHAIPAIGSKFGLPPTMGPMGQPAVAAGNYSGRIDFYFGKLPAS